LSNKSIHSILSYKSPIEEPFSPHLPVYPQPFLYLKYLKRILKFACEDVKFFLSHSTEIVISECVLGDIASTLIKKLPPNTLERSIYEGLSLFLFSHIFNVIFRLYIQQYTEQDKEFYRRSIKFQRVKLSTLGVAPELCLGEEGNATALAVETMKFEKEKEKAALAAGLTLPSSSLPSPTSPSPPPSSSSSASPSSASGPGPFSDLLTKTALITKGYEDAVTKMKGLLDITDPTKKVDCIVSVARSICACVDHVGGAVVIGADDLLLLFTHILIRSRLPHLHAEIRFMDEYMTEQHRMLMTGYYLATTQAASEMIMSHDLRRGKDAPDSSALDSKGTGEDDDNFEIEPPKENNRSTISSSETPSLNSSLSSSSSSSLQIPLSTLSLNG